LAHAVFEFPVGGLEDEQNVVDEWPRVVPTLVPSSGALFQCLVVPVLVFFDNPLQADVSADFKA
jgi:hypothetical protein